jgi:hypothetical protein
MRDRYTFFAIATVLEAQTWDAERCRPQTFRPGYEARTGAGALTGRSTGWSHGGWMKYFTRHRCVHSLLHAECGGRR